jgi:starvation-inducible outer membrane lipoprotein
MEKNTDQTYIQTPHFSTVEGKTDVQKNGKISNYTYSFNVKINNFMKS